MDSLRIKEKALRESGRDKRVHPGGALFLFGDKAMKTGWMQNWQIGGKG